MKLRIPLDNVDLMTSKNGASGIELWISLKTDIAIECRTCESYEDHLNHWLHLDQYIHPRQGSIDQDISRALYLEV